METLGTGAPPRSYGNDIKQGEELIRSDRLQSYMDGEIDPEEVQRALEDGDTPLIVDIRSPAAFKQGHIPGSRNVPFGELPDRVESLSDAEHIVTVCPHGKASVQAARMIGSYEGVDDARVDSMAGGLSEWPGGLETETETAEGDTDTAAGEPTDAPF